MTLENNETHIRNKQNMFDKLPKILKTKIKRLFWLQSTFILNVISSAGCIMYLSHNTRRDKTNYRYIEVTIRGCFTINTSA